jgi:single-stranded-DNA-specific exonuclease
MDFADQVGSRFVAWLADTAPQKSARVHVVCDFDGDGLPSGALLWHALHAAAYEQTTVECRRKGESAWGDEIRARLRERQQKDGIDALIVADLGSRDGAILQGVPLLLIDHHRPIGQPEGSTLITSYGTGDEAGDGKDVATTGLLSWWCARALCGDELAAKWLWLAGISLLSDLGDKAPFVELATAKARFGGGALRDATSLLNAPRRTAEGRADAALALLLKANGPKDVTSGKFSETAELLRAKAEVAAALAVARKQPPRFSRAMRDELGADLVAIRMHTAAQVHPLVAQQWRGRFPRSVIFGVNTGYRPGWVTFSGRAPAGVNLIEFLARHRPEQADVSYGLGHNQASGGALPIAVWNKWIRELGFGDEMLADEARPDIRSQSSAPPGSELAEEVE